MATLQSIAVRQTQALDALTARLAAVEAQLETVIALLEQQQQVAAPAASAPARKAKAHADDQ